MASSIHSIVKPKWWGEFQKTKGGPYYKPVAESGLTLESIPNEWALPTIMHKVNLIISLNMGRSQGGRRERDQEV